MPIEPEVRLVANSVINWENIVEYVNSVGGCKWTQRIEEDYLEYSPETIVEFMGRLCYRSWDKGLNPNVTKVRDDSEAYLQNINQSGHGSVLEHISFSFIISNVSRVFTHELVRHRVGTAISQESLRYVRLDTIPFTHPDWVLSNPKLKEQADKILALSEQFQIDAAEQMEIDAFGTPFAKKKAVTSDMRRYAPEGLLTTIGWSANLRSIRHCLTLRTSIHAERELRLVFDKIGFILKEECPMLMSDFTRSDDGEWTSKYKI